ncbi:hypothetical protein ABTX24_13055 [Nocardioides sp. NPDC127514]|uniref:hypothetical protein n=1 Tax=unclassified Nocardioides TaxID=2615069 RepID=UPI003321D5C9
MFLIEIAAPAGALTDGDRATLTNAVISLLTAGVSAPEETMARGRAVTHIAFRELVGWSTGDGAWAAPAPPPLVITATVPEGWREEMSRPLSGAVRAGVRRLDRDHGWTRPGGHLWINLVGILDGSIGLNGRPATADDLTSWMTEEFRARQSAGEVDLPEGVVIDPVCGMQVTLGRGAITLEHDGETIGFCAASCRRAYAKEHGIPA